MTLDGYLFMRGRWFKTDPGAQAKVVASAKPCPDCGPRDDFGSAVNHGANHYQGSCEPGGAVRPA
jgi:hypothetical protein